MTGRHLFARHTGRHRRRLFRPPATGSQPVDDFSQVRTPPALVSGLPFPLAADGLPPVTSYRYPYPSKGDAA